MSECLRVSIADKDSTKRRSLKSMLEALGHTVVSQAQTDEQLARDLSDYRPDVAVADLDITEHNAPNAVTSTEGNVTPVVVIADSDGAQKVGRALSLSNAVGYLARPFGKATLDGVMRFAIGLFGRFRSLQSRLGEFQRSLANRATIEKAKQIVMQRMNLNEPEAHRRLQKLASSSNKKLADLAHDIVAAAEAEQT